MRAMTPVLIAASLLTACAPSVERIQTAIAETQALWTPVPATPAAIVGVLLPAAAGASPQAPTSSNAQDRDFVSGAWVPPTVEQAKAAVSVHSPADVAARMPEFETKASGHITAAVSIESSWNQGVGNDYHFVTFGRNSTGNVLWSNGPIGYNEFPMYWGYDVNGALIALDGTYAEIPDSKDAVVVFTGSVGQTGNGDKPAIVKDVVELPDGTQVFARYFNGLTGEWETNPNMPQEILGMPEGATGQNARGEWLKTVTDESGKTVTYEWKENDPGSGEKITGWFVSHILNKIPLLEANDENLSDIDMIPMSVYFMEGVAGPYFRHPDGPGTSTLPTLTAELQKRLGERYYSRRYRQVTFDEWFAFGRMMEDGISIPFSTPFGSYEFRPSPNIGYRVYMINWDEADPVKDSRFLEWEYYSWDEGLHGRSMTMADADGNVVAVIATKKPLEMLSDDQILGTLLFPLIRVSLSEDQSPEFYINRQKHDSAIMNFDSVNGRFLTPSTPHIEVVDTPEN